MDFDKLSMRTVSFVRVETSVTVFRRSSGDEDCDKIAALRWIIILIKQIASNRYGYDCDGPVGAILLRRFILLVATGNVDVPILA
jgi:hypothetical protein